MTDLDQLREQLRALGYLDARVDRFVLGGLFTRGGLGALAANVGLRVGVLAGVAVGTALALAVALQNPQILRRPTDALLLAVYFSAITGIAVAALETMAGLIVAALARRWARAAVTPARVDRVARFVSALFTVVTLAYLALWWRTAPLGRASAHVAGTAAALGVSFAISLLIGHVAGLAAVGVLGRAVAGRPLAGWRARVWGAPVVVASALVYVAGYAALMAFSGRADRPPPDYAVVPTGTHIVLVAVDGVDPALLDRFLSGGVALPAIRALAERAVRLEYPATRERIPAVAWTSIATGHDASAHGITSLDARRLRGMAAAMQLREGTSLWEFALASTTDLFHLSQPRPLTSALRHEKALWDVAAEKGYRVGVVGWWATWPADRVDGFMISDRAVAKLDQGGGPDREIWPAPLFDALRSRWPALQQERAEIVTRAGIGTAPDVRQAAELDAETVLAGELARASASVNAPLDLYTAYLPGLDIVQHGLLKDAARDAADLADRLATLEGYYRFVDGLIDRIVRSIAPDTTVALVTDPGRSEVPGATLRGVAFVAGPAVRAGARADATPYDVAPTLLYLLGFPAARDASGRIVTGAIDPRFLARFPVRAIGTFGPRASPLPSSSESPFDEEMMRRLRSLGYLH